MTPYDPWSSTIKIFVVRFLQFIFLTIFLGLLIWLGLLNWYFDSDFFETTRVAVNGSNVVARALLILCLGNGTAITAWLFTWLLMRWSARHDKGDQHHRGAKVIYRDQK